VTQRARITVLALVLGALAVAMWSDFPLCPMAGTFGVPCPGCGLTRATLALLHGDVHGALRFHPLVWLMAPLFIGFVGMATLELVRNANERARPPRLDWSSRGVTVVAVFLLVAMLSVWLLRFAGYFGGPVPVVTLGEWLAKR
jgi:hypothetical protein